MVRRIFYPLLVLFSFSGGAQGVGLSITREKAIFLEDQDTVLVYQAGKTSLNGAFTRAHYIHPVHGLDGAVLTEDFPEDHLHHRGLFWAWHQLYIGDSRIGDGWEIKDFSWDVMAVDSVVTGAASKSLKAAVFWKSPQYTDANGLQKPLVKEHAWITVHPLQQEVRVIDITIKLWAMAPNMAIGGSEDEKGYGGFSARIKLPDDIQFNNETGTLQPTNTPVAPSAWMQMTGSLPAGGTFGFTIIPHKGNPGHPNPWILRSKASMQNAVFPYPGRNPVALSMEYPTVLRYRLLVHNHGLSVKDTNKFMGDYFSQK